MADALALLKEGDLDAALTQAKGAVRDDPGDPEARARLFQIFCLNGEWDRAEAQLDTLSTASAVQAPIWKQLQMLTRLERQRREDHDSASAPAIVGGPQGWMAGVVKACERHQSGDGAGGTKIREDALNDAPTVAGKCDGVEFEWLMDGYSRYAPMLGTLLPTEGD